LTRRQKREDSYLTYNHYAAPFSIILVTLFAIPAGIASGRQSVFRGILLALSLFLAYYAITALAMLLTNQGWVKPTIAVMLPSLFFGFAAIVLFRKLR
jgi:lipopolysaccharide export system permease protein